MRPLRLDMTAFGPYPKKVILDFAVLANQSMFLITGPTGAGKNEHIGCHGICSVWSN